MSTYTRYRYVDLPNIEIIAWEYSFNVVLFKVIDNDAPALSRFNDLELKISSKEKFIADVLPGYRAIYRQEV